MSVTDRDLLNRLLILSTAITEMIELEAKMVAERSKSNDLLAARKGYLSFWLRTQSFFITAKSLTDSEQFKSNYIEKTSKHWRFGVKVLRNFFAHKVDLIPSLHSSVRFIPEESVSISFEGFTISTDNADIILRKSIQRELDSESRDGKELSPTRAEDKYHTGSLTLDDWKSKPNPKVIVISDIATKYYIKIYELLDVKVIVSEENQSYSSIIPLKDKLQLIEDTVVRVKAYRANNFMWDVAQRNA